MTERALIVLAVVVVAWLATVALRRLQARRLGPATVPGGPSGAATLLYLHTVHCGQCRQQARAVEALEARLGDRLAVRRVDALAEPEVADRYRVWTVPATVVLDAAGHPRAVNCGLASAAQLEAQVREVVGPARGAA